MLSKRTPKKGSEKVHRAEGFGGRKGSEILRRSSNKKGRAREALRRQKQRFAFAEITTPIACRPKTDKRLLFLPCLWKPGGSPCIGIGEVCCRFALLDQDTEHAYSPEFWGVVFTFLLSRSSLVFVLHNLIRID